MNDTTKGLIERHLDNDVLDVMDKHPLPEGWAWLLRSVRVKAKDGSESLRFRAEDGGKTVLDVEGAVFLPCPVSDAEVLAYLRQQDGTTAYDNDGDNVQLNGAQKVAWQTVKLRAEQHRGGLRKAAKEGRRIDAKLVQEYLIGLHSGGKAAPVVLEASKTYTAADLIKLGVKVKVA